MKLFLASDAGDPTSIEKLEKYVNGFTGKSIAYIPTARNGESPYGSWETESSTWQLVQTLEAKITPVVLEEYRNKSVLPQLEGKDIIWFAGGSCAYLMYWIRRCEIDVHLPKLLEQGSIYVGSSAGSMITALTLISAEWYIGEEERGVGMSPGLALVDFNVYPHYSEELLAEIQKRRNSEKLYLLKDGEAITVTDGVVKVLGEERLLDGS